MLFMPGFCMLLDCPAGPVWFWAKGRAAHEAKCSGRNDQLLHRKLLLDLSGPTGSGSTAFLTTPGIEENNLRRFLKPAEIGDVSDARTDARNAHDPGD